MCASSKKPPIMLYAGLRRRFRAINRRLTAADSIALSARTSNAFGAENDSKTACGNYHGGFKLFAQFELGYKTAVTLDIYPFEIVELTAARADHLQKSATGMVILRVRFKVIRKVIDTPRKERDLHLGATRIALVRCKLGNDFRLYLFVHDFTSDKMNSP